MKKYIFPVIIACILVLSHIGITGMKALTDNQLNSVTGQAGIVGFDQAFASEDVNRDLQKKVFDQVFVKNSDLDTPQPDQSQTSFDEAFVNRLGLNFTEGTEQKLNLNIHMNEISFAQAFTKMTGLDMDLDKTVLNDITIHNLDIKVQGSVKIKFN